MSVRRIALANVGEIADLFFNSGVVAIPTDTVYGVAASVASPPSVARLFTLKDRPVTTPLPVMIADVADLARLGVDVDETASRVMATFWPGPLTIVLAAPAALAESVGAEASVGFRIPRDEDLRSVLRATGPLCVTSANIHGRPPCRDADEVVAAFGDSPDLDAVVDGGRRDGVVSTVLDLARAPWRIVRDGAVRHADLQRVIDRP